MPMRTGPFAPSKPTAHATLGITPSGITTAKGTLRSIGRGNRPTLTDNAASGSLGRQVRIVGDVEMNEAGIGPRAAEIRLSSARRIFSFGMSQHVGSGPDKIVGTHVDIFELG